MLAICKRYYRIPTTKVQLKDRAKVKFIGVGATCSGRSGYALSVCLEDS
jgi:hypothetical protein